MNRGCQVLFTGYDKPRFHQSNGTRFETDILFCDMLCFDAKNIQIYSLLNTVIYCKIRCFKNHYLEKLPKTIEAKTKKIKLVPIKILGTANLEI